MGRSLEEIVMTVWSEKYKGYVLKFTPYKGPGGKFAPNLKIERHEGSHVDVQTVGVVGGRDYYDTEEAAANAARIAGRQWVDAQG
jgi:hypothetical protein